MAGSRPQSHGYAISMENSLELSTTVVRFYQQQQQQWQLLQQQQQQQQQQINQQPQQYYINENQNCDDKDFDETMWWDQFEITSFFSFFASYVFLAINQCK